MTFERPTKARIFRRFVNLYGEEVARSCIERLEMMLGRYGLKPGKTYGHALWDESDVALITYADNIYSSGELPVITLKRFAETYLKDVINIIHLLPFFPYSSDDGFSVINYREVDPNVGSWSAIRELQDHFDLMFDFVLNHVSQKSDWFREFTAGIAPGRHFFITEDPETDLSQVTRPRSSPLLTPFNTRNGKQWVWTTFSEDQIDVNFKEPDLLFEYLDIFFYYLSRKARILRLDAVAFIWKEIGSSCLHLPQAHEIVKLFRDLASEMAPRTLMLTETNVPHQENISYFGDGDEAHMVYQFSLPPLLLHALSTENTSYLQDWASNLKPPPKGCTYFNFTASHDGIGVRPLTGLIPEKELKHLVERVKNNGGKVSMKRNADGSESPYELNITYFDAFKRENESLHKAAFLCSQAIALSLQGLPAVYFHSLYGGRNWDKGFKQTQRNRTLNRQKWDYDELVGVLEDPGSIHYAIFKDYRLMLNIRRQVQAFHPDAPQVIHKTASEIFSFDRISLDGNRKVRCVFNCSSKDLSLDLKDIGECGKQTHWTDLISGQVFSDSNSSIYLAPFQFVWLAND